MQDEAGPGRNMYFEGCFPGEEAEDRDSRLAMVRQRDQFLEDLKACAQAHAVEEAENETLRKDLNRLRRIVGIYADPQDASDSDRAIIRQCVRLWGEDA